MESSEIVVVKKEKPDCKGSTAFGDGAVVVCGKSPLPVGVVKALVRASHKLQDCGSRNWLIKRWEGEHSGPL